MITLAQTRTALVPGRKSFFQGSGGTSPYSYSVLAGGAGGTISGSGEYTAPSVLSLDPKLHRDTIRVIDNVGATTLAHILVTTPLGLVCDIIQKEMGLASGRVYFWDQKINEPTDQGLFIAVAVLSSKSFGVSNKHDSLGNSIQSVNMMSQLSIDAISRGPEARDRKEEILLALSSDYAQAQQEQNSFLIGRVSPKFLNLSTVDGAAIPYRFNITVNIQYAVSKTSATPYFDDFETEEVTIDP